MQETTHTDGRTTRYSVPAEEREGDIKPGEVRVSKPRHDRLDLEYRSERGSEHVHRTWITHPSEGVVRVADVATQCYDRPADEWHVREVSWEYGIHDDGETLKGDGSGWSGDGRYWVEYAAERHVRLLGLRFPYDDIPDAGEIVGTDVLDKGP